MENIAKLLSVLLGIFIAFCMSGCAELAPLIEDAIQNNPGVIIDQPDQPQPEIPIVIPTPTPEPVVEPSPEPTPTPTPRPKPEKPAPQGDCREAPYNCCFTDKPKRNRVLVFNGARNKFLWKAKSDHYTGGVFLIDGAYGRAEKVELCGKKKCISLQDFDGGNPDPEGCRHHWRDFTSPKKLNKQLGMPACFIIDDRQGDKLCVADLTKDRG